MKKTLLTIVAVIGLFASSFAQQCATGAQENFTSTTDQTNLYPWAGVVASSLDRTTGKLTFTLSQAQGAYEPFGISFGGLAPNENTIDISANGSFSATLKNNAPYNVIFRMGVQDVNNESIDTYAAALTDLGGFANAWMYPIQVVVNANSTGTISGTFLGGTRADYGTSSFDNGCDLTKIKGVTFTIVQEANTLAPLYQPFAIVAQSFELDNVSVGASCSASSTNAAANISTSKLFPNPVSEIATVEMELNSVSDVKVTVSDMMGKEIMTVTEGTMSSVSANINVADLNKGVYSVNYFINGAAAKSELLMVK